MATTCYECSGVDDSSCNDGNEGPYAGNTNHERDCSFAGIVESYGGCSKSKAKSTVVGTTVATGMIQVTQWIRWSILH